MEALLSSGGPQSDILIGPLRFGLDPQGSYVTQRRQATTFSNVNSASPAGVKTITINCGSSSEWLDPSKSWIFQDLRISVRVSIRFTIEILNKH